MAKRVCLKIGWTMQFGRNPIARASHVAVGKVASLLGRGAIQGLMFACFAASPVFAQSTDAVNEVLAGLTLEGTVQAGEKAFVANSIDGTIVAIHFEPGDHVEEGDLLFELYPAAFRLRLEASEAIVARRELELGLALRRAERASELRERGASPEAVALEASDNLAIARVALAEAEAQRNLAALQLSATRIKSPISGLIGPSRFQIGAYVKVATGQALAEVTRLDPVLISYSQPYDSLLLLNRAAPGRITDLWPRFRVSVVIPTGEKLQEVGRLRYSDNELQADRSLRVWAEMPNPNGVLVPGLPVELEVSLED